MLPVVCSRQLTEAGAVIGLLVVSLLQEAYAPAPDGTSSWDCLPLMQAVALRFELMPFMDII